MNGAQDRRDELETDLHVLGVKNIDLDPRGGVLRIFLKSSGPRPDGLVDSICERVARWQTEERECHEKKLASTDTST